jgi:hypothetical protein
MYLQLAEKPKRIQVGGYKRKSYVSPHSRRYPLSEPAENPYIFIPDVQNGGGLYIREDKFDSMPEEQFKRFVMAIAPWQPEVQNGAMSESMFLSNRAERKENRSRRKEAKTEKKEQRATNKQDKNQRKNDRRASKDEARASKEERKSNRKGFDWDKAKDTASSLISKFTGKGGEDESGNAGGGTDATPFYKNPLVLVGGALLIGGGIYLATRPKK